MEIHLEKIRVYGYHGLDAGEDIVGGEFEISLTTNYIPTHIPIYSLKETLDYTALLSLVQDKMKKPVHLLETLATEIASEIIAKFSIVTEVVISISKLHPPIEKFEGAVRITFKTKRN